MTRTSCESSIYKLEDEDGSGEKRTGLVYAHALYAARPPPPGALEDADLTDDDDLYDWYTWPRAIHVVRQNPRTHLRCCLLRRERERSGP